MLRFADDQVVEGCVDLGPQGQLSGLEVLQVTHMEMGIADFGAPLGAAVCRIGDVGCDYPSEECFACEPGGAFWAYFRREGNSWVFSELGASATTVTHGDVEGWSWGTGLADPPPPVSFTDICP